MTVLTIIAALLVAAGGFFGLTYFNNHCEKKFGFKFLTKPTFFLVVAGVLLVMFGNELRIDATKTGGDVLNGIVLIVIGTGVLSYMIYKNITETNIYYGVGGSAIQLVLFGVLGYVGLFVLILVAFGYFLLLMNSRTAWVIR
jgi:hypothetical protein